MLCLASPKNSPKGEKKRLSITHPPLLQPDSYVMDNCLQKALPSRQWVRSLLGEHEATNLHTLCATNRHAYGTDLENSAEKRRGVSHLSEIPPVISRVLPQCATLAMRGVTSLRLTMCSTNKICETFQRYDFALPFLSSLLSHIFPSWPSSRLGHVFAYFPSTQSLG